MGGGGQTLHSVNEKCLDFVLTTGCMSAERDGGGACFNTGTVLGLNHTTQRNATMNSVINHIPVLYIYIYIFFFSVWQLTEKSQQQAKQLLKEML